MNPESTTSVPARPEREEQALREVGRTEIGALARVFLAVAFLATVTGVPAWQAAADAGEGSGAAVASRLRAFLGALPRVARELPAAGPLAANRVLVEEIERFEDALEEESVLRSFILPPAQGVLTGWLGVGNEQAYLGRDGWLFFRADFDHVTGPGFLEPRVLERRRFEDGHEPDPLPAISRLAGDLAERGIDLIVLPTPVKPTIHPEFLAVPRARPPVRNASFAEFARRLENAGVSLFDPVPVLMAAKTQEMRPQYLRADTHWTPGALEWVASELARAISARLESSSSSPAGGYRQRVSVVEAIGDSALLLRLRAGQQTFAPQQVEALPVFDSSGRPWRSDPSAEVLVLGDSFTNIYSDASLGWGGGAGFAERLSFHLGRPVDRIARNAGGAKSSRQALVRALESGDDRLAGKRVVVYQFATRELSSGDWEVLALP